MDDNLFIAIEGIDGSGKSSQARLLGERMIRESINAYRTFEPTDNYIGAIIRNILKGGRKADERTIAGLFLADRLDHLLNEDYGIVKKLAEGFSVVSDRYYFSSYAYNGTHMDQDWVIAANKICTQIRRPDINIFIDVPPETCMQRIQARRGGIERYETMENLRKVRTKYTEAFDKLSGEEHVVIIDGNGTMEEIAEKIWLIVRQCTIRRHSTQ
jgi:dTMP kinase